MSVKTIAAALSIGVILGADLVAQTPGAPPTPPVEQATPPTPRPSADTLVASGQLGPSSALTGGSGISLDWIRRTGAGRVFTVGAASYSVGDSSWKLGRAGVVLSPTSRVLVAAQVGFGAGNAAGRSFGHRTLRGDVTFRARPGVSLTVGDEYLSIAGTHGHLVRTGANIRASRLTSVDATYARSAGGNLNTTFVLTRLDIATSPVAFFGGSAFGRTTPEVVGLTGAAALKGQDLRQGFFGVSVSVRRARMQIALDVLNFAHVRRRTLTFAAVLPIRP